MDALQQLAEMKISTKDDGSLIHINVNGEYEGNLFNRGNNRVVARTIEQLPKIAKHYLDAEHYLNERGEYVMQKNCLHGDHIREITTAIRGSEPETTEDQYRKALEKIDKELKAQQTNFDYIIRIDKIVCSALKKGD